MSHQDSKTALGSLSPRFTSRLYLMSSRRPLAVGNVALVADAPFFFDPLRSRQAEGIEGRKPALRTPVDIKVARWQNLIPSDQALCKERKGSNFAA